MRRTDTARAGTMKIAMVSEHASPLAAIGGVDAGGQNVHVAALSMQLARRGHEVTVYTRRDDPGLPHRVTMAGGVVVEHVPAGPAREIGKDDLLPFMEPFGQYLETVWGVETPDVVHAHFWMSGLAALTGARATGVPVMQTFHALGTVKARHQGARDTSPPQRSRLERAVARDVDHIVATCSDEVFELVRMGVDRHHVSVVPCGVDTEHFTTAGPVAPRTGRRRILSVGRLVERKGVDTVVRALPEVPGAELVIAGGPSADRCGDDPEVRRLRQVAADCGVGSRVVFLGRVGREELPALLRSADVAVCVPWYEPFGIVPLEAMACGLPVVASAVGGLVDTVVDGATGLLVPPQDPAALAVALRRLLADDGLRAAYGAAGADRAHARYRWERVAADTEQVYRRHAPAAAALSKGVLR
jgi:D-inositol-3-phosphate glycosyltransferase